MDNQEFQKLVLDRLARIEAATLAILELQALEGEAVNTQLHTITRFMTQSTVAIFKTISPGSQEIEVPDFPLLSAKGKYKEFYDYRIKQLREELSKIVKDSTLESPDILLFHNKDKGVQ